MPARRRDRHPTRLPDRRHRVAGVERRVGHRLRLVVAAAGVRVPSAVGPVDELVDLVVRRRGRARSNTGRSTRAGTRSPAGCGARGCTRSIPTRCPATRRRSGRCGGSCPPSPSSTAARWRWRRRRCSRTARRCRAGSAPGTRRGSVACGRPVTIGVQLRQRDEGPGVVVRRRTGPPGCRWGSSSRRTPAGRSVAVEAGAHRDAHEPTLAGGVEARRTG